MSKSQGGVLIAASLFIVFVLGWMFFRPWTFWQYRVGAAKDAELPEYLAKLGADGWEMVSARRALESEPANPDKPEVFYEMIFKRPVRTP